jgi:hypothetical protein
MVALFVVVSACGGDDSVGDATTPETPDGTAANDAGDGDGDGDGDGGSMVFMIDGVVVTLDVPDGALAVGTEIEIADGNLPPGLAQISEITAYAFDLEPSGLEFSQPATITFRLAAPGDTGTPLVLVIIESEDGTANVVSSEVTRHGDEVEVSALVDHFSQAYLVLPDGTEVVLTPELLHMGVGESGRSEMKFRRVRETSFTGFTTSHAYFYEDGFDLNVLPVASGFITAAFKGTGIEVTCLEKTDGVIENAYEAIVENHWNSEHPWMDGMTGSLAGVTSRAQIRLLGDVECDAVAATTSTTTTTEPPTGSDPVGDQEDSSTSEQVEAGKGEPGGDIENVRNEADDAGRQCFVVHVAGDGEALATGGTGWYDIIFGVEDPDGEEWRANVAYFEPTPTDRGVYLGPPAPGQQKVEGATVTAEWVDRDTLRACVDGGETSLAVATFKVSIGVSTPNGTFWDYATGIGEA